MEDWEAKSPLGELEVKSINALKELCEERRLPLKFSAEESSFSRSSTPVPKGHFIRVSQVLSTPSRPSTPISRTEAGPSNHHLHPRHSIQTPEQFHDWFGLLERSVTHNQDSHFHAHLEEISSYRMSCEKLLDTVDSIDDEVGIMLGEWRSVEEGGRSLKDACEKLLQEKDRLLDTTEAISLRLEYFQELEHATRMLNHPGESLVLQTDFLLMVERVDVCLEYLDSHRDFREAEIYLLRFQQCLTRAMTLIKMFFVGSLKALFTDIYRRMSDKDVSETAHIHLLYSKFITASYSIAPLLAELERRTEQHPDEIASLLTECHTAYFETRKSLLATKLMEDIKGLDPVNSELVELTRTGCTYVRQLCMDEFDLFRRFFNTGEPRLYNFLESLCDYLFDDLRPRILHEARLTTLCEVCKVLQALMILDLPPSVLFNPELHKKGRESQHTYDDVESDKQDLGKLQIKPILQLLLQDAQTRLLFKAQAVMESDIRSYKPKPEDLTYPEKLTNTNWTHKIGSESVENRRSWSLTVSSLEDQATWYPTLQKTLWILSQLHEFINPEVFDDIAHEAIHLCRHSLKVAADNISTKVPSNFRYDGLLFFVRHLLILKEVVSSLELKERNVPGRSTTDSVGSVLRSTSAFLSSAGFLNSIGIAREEENFDVRDGIDHDLKNACEELINQGSMIVTQPIQEFLERCDTFHSGKLSTQTVSLADRSSTQPTDVIQKHADFQSLCEKETIAWVSQLQTYLKSQEAILVLIAPYQMKIVEVYSTFRDLVSREYPAEVLGQLMSLTDLWSLLNKLCNR